VFQKLFIRWGGGDNSYCYLIVPLFAYLLWERYADRGGRLEVGGEEKNGLGKRLEVGGKIKDYGLRSRGQEGEKMRRWALRGWRGRVGG